MILDIIFKDNEKEFETLQKLFNGIGEQALYMNHYQLAEQTGESPISWKRFLTDQRVATLINEELELVKRSKVAVMLSQVDTNKNTGQAQLLNTLLNQTKQTDKKEGPVFIYTMIPLSEQEQGAKDVRIYED